MWKNFQCKPLKQCVKITFITNHSRNELERLDEAIRFQFEKVYHTMHSAKFPTQFNYKLQSYQDDDNHDKKNLPSYNTAYFNNCTIDLRCIQSTSNCMSSMRNINEYRASKLTQGSRQMHIDFAHVKFESRLMVDALQNSTE